MFALKVGHVSADVQGWFFTNLFYRRELESHVKINVMINLFIKFASGTFLPK